MNSRKSRLVAYYLGLGLSLTAALAQAAIDTAAITTATTEAAAAVAVVGAAVVVVKVGTKVYKWITSAL